MNPRDEPSTLREALFDELDAPGSITKSRIRNLLIRYPEAGPRTITTEEELDDLPKGSVVLSDVYISNHGQAISFQRWEDGLWHRGARSSFTHPDNFLPVTVLYTPEAA